MDSKTKVSGARISIQLLVINALICLGGRRQLYVKMVNRFVYEFGSAHDAITQHLAAGEREKPHLVPPILSRVPLPLSVQRT